MSVAVSCPHCLSTFRSKSEIPADKKVRCPKCNEVFRYRPAETAIQEGGRKAPATAKMSVEGLMLDVPQELTTEPIPAAARNGRRALIAAVIGLVVVLFLTAGAIATAVAIFQRTDESGDPVARNEPPLDIDDPALQPTINDIDKPKIRTQDEPPQSQQPQKPPSGGTSPKSSTPKSTANKSGSSSSGPSGPIPRYEPPKLKSNTTPKSSSYRSALSKEHQEMVNKAIDRGVAWLRKQQNKSGYWEGGGWDVGYTALAGLTLLECGAKADDPAVRQAAQFVRFQARSLRNRFTYQASLAILFLDKLGDKRDRPLIRQLAMRLIAGQTARGGWDYECPPLTDREQYELITFLNYTRPLPTLIVKHDNRGLPVVIPDPNAKKTLPTIITGKKKPPLQTPVKGHGKTKKKKKKGGILIPFDDEDERKEKEAKEKSKIKPTAAKGDGRQVQPKRPRPPFPKHRLSKRVQQLPIVQQDHLPPTLKQAKKRRNRNAFLRRAGRDDNSNTQFAILALWAARRHGVPVDRTLALVDERFELTQMPDGSWGYMPGVRPSPQMTCVGLIGLAVGHGAYHEAYQMAANGKNKAFVKSKADPRIQKGLRYLSQFVRTAPKNWKQKTPMQNLYFLWSLERTAMLYNLPTIGGKDWYKWAAQMLVSNQQPNGSWAGGRYHGSSPTLDTCMALLILRRANLAEDLSRSLELLIPIADPKRR